MKRSRRKAALLLCSVAGALLLGEGLLRWCVPSLSIHRFDQKRKQLVETGSDAFQRAILPDPVLFWRFKPGVVITDPRARPFFQGRISNNLGLRNGEDLESVKPPGTLRVLAIGDSCTFGVGVDQPACWPARLEARLRAACSGERREGAPSWRVEVLNAGVPGYTSFQGLHDLRRRGPVLAPDLVIACFGWNDRVVWDNRTDRFIARYLAGGRGTGLEGLLSRSRLYLAARKVLYSLEATLRFGPRTPRVPVEEYVANCRAMAEAARGAGAGILFLLWPKRDQAGPAGRPLDAHQQALLRFCREEGLPLVDLRAVTAGEDGPSLYIDEGHMNAEGYDRVAEAVFRAVRAEGLLPL